MTHEWITHRLPTEADANGHGDVRVPRDSGGTGWWFQHYTLIVPGQPWWSEKAAERAEVEPVAALSFAVGQQWRRRSGAIATITHLHPDTDLPILVDGKCWHYANGASCLGLTDDDLIELVSGPAPAPAPCLKSLTDDQLQAHFVAVQAETLRRVAARYIVEAKRPGGLLA